VFRQPILERVKSMPANELHVRINVSEREVEIRGTEDQVREWYERLESIVLSNAPRRQSGGSEPPRVAAEVLESDTSFGEHLQSFPRDVTDVDRALMAGLFLQQLDPDKVFSTSAVSDLLREQGYKLSNASMSVKRNLTAGRIFIQSKGKFRVSQAGQDYLAKLRNGTEAAS
jgi:hypothetical protein